MLAYDLFSPALLNYLLHIWYIGKLRESCWVHGMSTSHSVWEDDCRIAIVFAAQIIEGNCDYFYVREAGAITAHSSTCTAF